MINFSLHDAIWAYILLHDGSTNTENRYHRRWVCFFISLPDTVASCIFSCGGLAFAITLKRKLGYNNFVVGPECG